MRILLDESVPGRLGAMRTNERVLPFWKKQRFSPTGEVRSYRYGAVISESIILTKALDL